jgi:Neuraminidase (sialidase)
MQRFACCLVVAISAFAWAATTQTPVLLLEPTGTNSRNSEGDFVQLADGRVLFVYTHFTAGTGDDFDSAYLASRESRDGGETWTPEDTEVLPNEGGLNTMSVSLERLPDGTIALFYLRKNGKDDCRPYLRISRDESATWSEPIAVSDKVGYYVVNNDRLVQLKRGRLVAPAAIHAEDGASFTGRGHAICFLSDDGGATWRRSVTMLTPPDSIASGYQEPGVVELADGTLLMLIRTSAGVLYRSRSTDGGETWSAAEPTELKSPVSPATVERIPGTETLLLVWNDHRAVSPELASKRTPFTAAVSKDEGATWQVAATVEDDPNGWYCYTAMECVGDHVLLGYCAGDRTKNNGLAVTKVVRLPLAMFSGQ